MSPIILYRSESENVSIYLSLSDWLGLGLNVTSNIVQVWVWECLIVYINEGRSRSECVHVCVWGQRVSLRVHTYIHTYIMYVWTKHTYTYTYIHTYTHIYIHATEHGGPARLHIQARRNSLLCIDMPQATYTRRSDGIHELIAVQERAQRFDRLWYVVCVCRYMHVFTCLCIHIYTQNHENSCLTKTCLDTWAHRGIGRAQRFDWLCYVVCVYLYMSMYGQNIHIYIYIYIYIHTHTMRTPV